MYFLKGKLLLNIIMVPTIFLSLTGCWSAINIQDQLYITALGVNYDNEVFTIYAQMFDFNNISRTEGTKGSSSESTFIGKGQGKTMNEAVFDLYKTTQTNVEWGHMGTVVVNVKAMETLGPTIVERIYRSPSTRYNTWLYVTEAPIEQIFAATSFFSMSSLFTILHNPTSNYQQDSAFPPMLMFKYIVDSNENDRIIYIPSIGMNDSQWLNGEKQMEMLMITGAYFESSAKKTGLFNRQQLIGIHWLDNKFKRVDLVIEDKETIYANLTILHPKIKIQPRLQNGEVKYKITAKYQATMQEYLEEIPYEQLVKLTEDKIKKEIMKVYSLGVENNLDLFSLMHPFRLKYPSQWKSLTNNGANFILNEESIESLEVHVRIPSNGKYKRMIIEDTH